MKGPGKHRLCRCGCGTETGSRHRRWVEGHYTFQARSENWQRTRGWQVFRKQCETFKAEIDRMGQRISKQDVLAVLHDVRLKGYRAGYLAGRATVRKGWRRAA